MNRSESPVDELESDDRYRVLRELSDASIVSCYLAEDKLSRARVILREVPKSVFRQGGLARFENEARQTAGVRCRTYSSPLEYEVRDQLVRVVYAYIEGDSLATRFRARPFTAPQAMLLAEDLLQALEHVHELGCIQKDIRPSNIIVQPDGHAVMCGYVPLWCPDVFGNDSRLGRECASYTSPELSGIIDHDIGEASDIYSIGYVLHAAITGGPAFDGEISEIFYQHMTADPDFSQVPQNTPEIVIRFIEKMIRKEPRERYQSARAALYDARKILKLLNTGADTSGFVIGSADHRTVLTDAAFVGRDDQLKVLEQGLDNTLAGKSCKALLRSDSGMGKTRLLNEISRVAARKGFLLLNGRSSQHAAQEPNAPWLQMIDQLAKLLATDEELRTRTADRMEDYREEVTTAMPELAKTLGWSGIQLSGPEELGQKRVIMAFRTLFAGLGTADRSVMVTLDDCQWIDEQSMRILAGICETPVQHLFLFVVARPEGNSTSLELNELPVSTSLSLQPLNDQAVKQLAESMAGHLPEVAVNVVTKYADGSPFMAAAVLRGMVESNVLIAADNAWKVDDEKLSSFQAADDASEILVSRLSQLPDEARDLLAAAAVIGKDFNLDAAADLAGISMAEAQAAIKPVRHHRLVWSRPNNVVSFVHDKIREAVLSGLSETTIQSMHGQIGRYIEANNPERYFDLAYHFDAADMHFNALPYALKAAEAARKSFSHESAETQLGIAARALEFADITTRHSVEMMMADVLILQGEYDRTEEWLDRASRSAGDDTALAKVALKRGELSFKRGNKDRAVTFFEAALTQLGHPVCNSQLQLWWNLGREVLRQANNSIFPARCGRIKTEPTQADRMSLLLYSQIAHAYWFTRDKYYTLWAHLRGMNAAEEYSPNQYLAQSYSEHAPVMTLLRWERRGVAYAKKSLEMRKSLDDVWGQGQSRNFLSILLYSFSRFQQCVEQASLAVDTLERTGDYWEVHIARYQLAASHYRLGNLSEAVRLAKINYQSAVDRGDFQATGNIIDVWSRAAMGDIPKEIIQAEMERDVFDVQRSCEVLLAKGVREYYRERYQNAVGLFQKAILTAEDGGVSNAYISPCYPWLCSAMRKLFETKPPRTEKARRKMVRALVRASKTAVGIGKRYTNELPHALRELGAAYTIAENFKRGQAYLRKSIEESLRQGASVEHAFSVVLHVEYASELGWKFDADEYQAALDSLASVNQSNDAVNAQGSLSLLDRFDSLLASGRRIATTMVPDEIHTEVCKAAKRILRAENVFLVLETEPGQDLVTIPQGQRFDVNLVAEARSSRTTVVNDTENICERGVCSVREGTFMCSPIEINGDAVAYLYLTNQRFSGLFDDDEVRIADYLTSAAGAALEKADSFQKLQELNQTLEARILERTMTVVQRSQELENTATQLQATKDKLEKAKEAAEEANATKSEFLARMSHEIRTPITAILGFTELLLRGVVDSEQSRISHLQTILSNGTHLLNLLNDILDISKIEADKIETECVPCSPTHMVGDVVKSLRSKAIQNNIGLDIEMNAPVPSAILSDPTRFRQIISNLLSNAIKFTEQGGVTVVLDTQGPDEAPTHLVVSVNDTGTGMTPQQLQKIFEPFTQADTSTTRKFGGTGLGLSISKRLADALGGSLTVWSELDVGTKFNFLLPIVMAENSVLLTPSAAMQQAEGTQSKEFPRVSLSGTRVLVVDDAVTNRNLMQLIVEDSGGVVYTATNGEEAIEKLISDQLEVDVILMDMQMPIMDGYTATSQLRSVGFMKPIIALTANAMQGDENRCRTAGCTGYLTKPLDLNALLNLISDAAAEGDTKTTSDVIAHTPKGATSEVNTNPIKLVEQASENSIESELTSILPQNWLRSFACEFVERVSDKLPSILDANDAGDLNEVARHLHWIKGTGGSVGLTPLSEMAADGEAAVATSDVEQVYETLKEMQSFLAKARQEQDADSNQSVDVYPPHDDESDDDDGTQILSCDLTVRM
ncbi:ATP-binding protein [Aporhodopirellula aestuarii]|uniref:histidine kinase n=1 Tax=Aporhodopirellula aestuarii TaxID=2950107 RepID=A0ABT0TZ84_9BACT|nr:ATP-binding protein [Aporhodopirellula aestuarii]MCM2369913.1 ATP-binding protein [Aporhodopirellula aestuarii]